MAKSSVWKAGGLGALVCIVSLVIGKIERANRYEENSAKFQAGYYDDTTVKNGKVIPNEQAVFIPPKTWTNYEISDAFTLSVPNTLELRNKDDRYTREVRDISWRGYKIDLTKVVFQQKSLSVNDAEAFETYSRVIIDYVKGQPGNFYKATELEELGVEEILNLQEQVKKGCIATGFHLIGTADMRWIRIGNIYGLEIAYVRSGTEGKRVRVYVYSFFNYDETVNMILSYWLDDRERWGQDFKNLVRTFAWNELK